MMKVKVNQTRLNCLDDIGYCDVETATVGTAVAKPLGESTHESFISWPIQVPAYFSRVQLSNFPELLLEKFLFSKRKNNNRYSNSFSIFERKWLCHVRIPHRKYVFCYKIHHLTLPSSFGILKILSCTLYTYTAALLQELETLNLCDFMYVCQVELPNSQTRC